MVLGYTLLGTLGLALYTIATTVAGRWWSLLAVVIVLGSSTVWSTATQNVSALMGSIATLLAIGCLAQFIEKPSRLLLGASGATLGIALATHPAGILLLAIEGILLIVHLVATIVRDWTETDPALRRNRFYIRTIHYIRGGIVMMGVALLVFYSVALVFQWQNNANPSIAENIFVRWMMNNPALRPIGLHALRLIAERNTAQTMSAVAIPWSLVAMAAFVAALIAIRTFKKIHHVADELTLHYTEWALASTLGIFALIHYAGLTTLALLTILPLFAILASESIKTWFEDEDPALHRNLHINIELTENTRLAIALKTATLGALFIWYWTETIFTFIK